MSETPDSIQAEVALELLRDVLEALCRQRGLSLDSEAEPGRPARNYELADRLGIGEVVFKRRGIDELYDRSKRSRAGSWR